MTVKTEPVIVKLLVYDPRNAQDWRVVTSPFENSETTSLTATFPVTIAGLMGYQSLRGVYSTLKGVDLADIPQLILPPDIRVIDDKQGYWYFAYSFQQYLWQSKEDPKQGWGVFGQYAMSDGNPNPIHQSWYLGVGGSSFIPGRDLDLWGIGCFQYRFSDDLKYSLAVLGLPLRDESGVEAFYNLAVTPWFRWTANVEYVQPGLGYHADAVFLGMRSQIKFYNSPVNGRLLMLRRRQSIAAFAVLTAAMLAILEMNWFGYYWEARPASWHALAISKT